MPPDRGGPAMVEQALDEPISPESRARTRVRRAATLLLSALRTVVIVWLSLVVILSLIQRKLMYQPATASALPITGSAWLMNLFPDARDIEFASHGGHTIRGWYLCQNQQTAPRRPLVLLLHGNAGNRAGRVSWYELLHHLDCDVLAIDYQGYGDSAGKPSQTALEADSLAAWNYGVEQLGCRPDQIVIMGISLGGAAAVHVAAEQSRADAAPAGLVTVATFSSMVDVAASVYPWMPVRTLLLDRYPSADRIPQVTSPIIHLHGNADRVVDQRFGRELFEQAPDTSACGIPKRWVDLQSAGHNDLLLISRQRIQDELAEFLGSVAAAGRER